MSCKIGAKRPFATLPEAGYHDKAASRCDGRDSKERAMANDENESALFAAAREPPPRALTRVSPMVRRLVAPNPSPFTFNGTCTYIVGQGRVAIVDPGPDDDSHLAALLAAVEGEQIETILITHTHRDHSVGAKKLRAATGAQVIGAAPFTPRGDGSAGLDSAHDRDYSPDLILADGEGWPGGGYTIEAVATPGHCSNHLCFALRDENALFSGDHVMGWSTSIVAPPDGSMRAYMDSLDKMRGRLETIYWPGHGGPVVEPQRYLRALIHHRRQREVSILNTLANGPQTIAAMVGRIYVGLNPSLTHAAGLSTLAHLEDLSERGMVVGEAAAGGEQHFRLA
jgi:glyoxylase-like metal-dependent hydrolase (beta-lactamase superfamily II)